MWIVVVLNNKLTMSKRVLTPAEIEAWACVQRKIFKSDHIEHGGGVGDHPLDLSSTSSNSSAVQTIETSSFTGGGVHVDGGCESHAGPLVIDPHLKRNAEVGTDIKSGIKSKRVKVEVHQVELEVEVDKVPRLPGGDNSAFTSSNSNTVITQRVGATERGYRGTMDVPLVPRIVPVQIIQQQRRPSVEDDEIERLTDRINLARISELVAQRQTGNSCLPRRIDWSTLDDAGLVSTDSTLNDGDFSGPPTDSSSEGRRPTTTGVSSKSIIGVGGGGGGSTRDRIISASSSQPQLHQHQHLILVNNQPVLEDSFAGGGGSGDQFSNSTSTIGGGGGLVKSMSSPNLKSPGRPVTPKKDDKDETFWDKIGTLGRKKRIKEVQNFEQEGKNAIDSPGSPTQFDISPDEYDLAEGDERSLIERRSYADPKLQHLISLLIDWINDELADQRIIVKNIEDDLYDGQILQKLLEKLTGRKLEVPEVSQSEEGQRHKLLVVLNACTQELGLPRWSQQKWSVESIHSKNLVSILYLLVHLVRHFRAPLRLPENVNVETVVVKKRNGKLEYDRVTEEITSTYDEFGMRCERDAIDALLDHAADKLVVVKKSLITFVNKHLNKINLEVTDIESQFHDGVYLILLMGLLEGYFVPLFEFHLTPKDFEQKVFNVAFSFELMQDAGISKPKARPEDIVNVDLKSTLRVLYNLFAKYKNVN